MVVVGIALSVVLATVSAGASAVPGGGAAVRVVRQYIAALDRHDGAAVCKLFARPLRTFEAQWVAPPVGRPTCASAVHAHFTGYYSRHRWERAAIVGQPRMSVDARTGIAAVMLTLRHRYVCAAQSFPPEPCRPGVTTGTDFVYLMRSRGAWQIIKPGGVYRASEIDSLASVGEDFYYPPGTPSTVSGTADIPPPGSACPTGTSTTVGPHSLTSTFEPNPRGGPGNEPWLTIRALSAAPLSSDTMCFSITLAGAPRPDSTYSIFIGTPQEQGAADFYEVAVDGLGQPHMLLAGQGAITARRLRPLLPKAFLEGSRLEIIGTHPFFARHAEFLIVAGTASTQSEEPLLRRPIDAGDGAPLGGCLTYPTGSIDRSGLCGSQLGP